MSESRADSTVAAADAAKDSAASPMPLAGIDIREVLRRQGEATAAEVGELLAADQMARWQRGQRIPAEAYLQLHPAVAADGSEAFDLVFNEYCLREELGERPAVEEYLWRFPRFAERFRRQLELHRAVGEVQAEPVTDAPAATEASTADPTLRQWPTVPGYEVLSELGRGGMGVVYKARQVGLRRLVALKMILQGARAGAELFARFRREAQVIARLQHPHIVQIHEIGEQDGQPFFSMELVAGGSLADHLEGTPLNPGVAAGLVETLA
ncbi:MAG TPA: protein kinase, partial [Gemmataceae bacterium]|nr:protein kinase [Gemmataceae bacterium]